MSAEAFGRNLPAVVTLDDLATMNTADQHGHRYELSPEGALSIMPPPDSEHAVIASRLFAWLVLAGWPADQLLQAVGVRISGPDGDGGRIPDLTVWSRSQPRSVWLAVTLHVLGPDKSYQVAAKMPLAWLLQTAPADHHLDG